MYKAKKVEGYSLQVTVLFLCCAGQSIMSLEQLVYALLCKMGCQASWLLDFIKGI